MNHGCELDRQHKVQRSPFLITPYSNQWGQLFPSEAIPLKIKRSFLALSGVLIFLLFQCGFKDQSNILGLVAAIDFQLG